jgi:hypothetical protein
VLAPGVAALIVVTARSVAASGAVTESTPTGGVLEDIADGVPAAVARTGAPTTIGMRARRRQIICANG